jgi:hypothetical protein
MSMIIKGLDIPEDDVYFIVICGDGSIAFRNGLGEYNFLDDAQAIQIPSPHGRLIDANDVFTYDHMAQKQLDEVPTILESEE